MKTALRPSVSHAAVAAAFLALTLPLHAQKATPADLAARISGRWTINRSLSPGIGGPGRSGPPRGGGPGVMPVVLLQRGGGGSGAAAPGDMTPAELAERATMRGLLQISPEITIKASADSVSFTDVRGETICTADGKAAELNVPNVKLALKCRWDKEQLRQEFASTRTKLTRLWSVDGNDHLVLKARVEAIGQDTAEATIFFDRAK